MNKVLHFANMFSVSASNEGKWMNEMKIIMLLRSWDRCQSLVQWLFLYILVPDMTLLAVFQESYSSILSPAQPQYGYHTDQYTTTYTSAVVIETVCRGVHPNTF